MKYWAIVNLNTLLVENCISWDGASPWSPPENTIVVDITDIEDVGIGRTYDPVTESFNS